MTVTAAFCPLSAQTILDANGDLISGAKLYFYDSQTTTPRAVYRDADLSLAHSSPVLTNAYGRVPVIFVGLGAYKVVVKDADGASLYTLDRLPGGTEPEPEPEPGATGWETGDLKWSYSNAAQDGWLICNGRTIGNAASGATARANADTADLFAKLWNTNSSLAVSGGRGASATGDYAAAKTIALPDARGRTLAGVDGMGASLAGILTSATITGPDTVGAMGGAETVALAAAELRAITTTIGGTAITVGQMPAHAHGVNDAGHTHSVNDPGHNHDYTRPNLSAGGAGGGGNWVETVTVTKVSSDATGVTVNSALAGVTLQNNGSNEEHTHTASSSYSGSAPTAHDNLQPTMLGILFIKL